MELGDDAAAAVGVGVERTRLAYLALGVALIAAATAVAGPISFVALAAPQLAHAAGPHRRDRPGTVRSHGRTAAHGQRLGRPAGVAPTQLPVGVVTVSIGGLLFRVATGPPGEEISMTRLRADGITVGYDRKRSSPTWTSQSPTAGSPSSSAPTPAASRPCCGRWPGCSSPAPGTVLLDGQVDPTLPVQGGGPPARAAAAVARSRPDGITVADLVARGRYPHQRLLRQWSAADEQPRSPTRMAATGVDRAGRPARRRAVRRPAATGLGRDGARPADPDRCCSTSRPRSWTSPTRSSCWTSCAVCTRSRAAPWSPSCTTSTMPAGTPTTCRDAGRAVVAEGDPAHVVDRRAGRGGLRAAVPRDRDPETRTPAGHPRAGAPHAAALPLDCNP